MGGLDEKVSEAILWELFLQAGPVGKLRKTRNYELLIAGLLHRNSLLAFNVFV